MINSIKKYINRYFKPQVFPLCCSSIKTPEMKKKIYNFVRELLKLDCGDRFLNGL